MDDSPGPLNACKGPGTLDDVVSQGTSAASA